MTKLKTTLVKSSELKTPLVKGDRVYYCSKINGKFERSRSDKGTVKCISAAINIGSDKVELAVIQWDTGDEDDADPVTGNLSYGTVRRARWQSKAKAQ